jgi:hypothetical protein
VRIRPANDHVVQVEVTPAESIEDMKWMVWVATSVLDRIPSDSFSKSHVDDTKGLRACALPEAADIELV